MRAFASRLIDARNTVEGRILSVLLSVLLVASLFNVAIFTLKANADVEEEEIDDVTTEQVATVEDPVEDTLDVPDVEAPEEEPAPTEDPTIPEEEPEAAPVAMFALAPNDVMPTAEEAEDDEQTVNDLIAQIIKDNNLPANIEVLELPTLTKDNPTINMHNVGVDPGKGPNHVFIPYIGGELVEIKTTNANSAKGTISAVETDGSAVVVKGNGLVIFLNAADNGAKPLQLVVLKVELPEEILSVFTVTYDLNGGSSDETLVHPGCERGTQTPTISDPAREGYIFTGWSPEVAPTVTGNATYTAQWSEIVKTYTVTYKDGVDGDVFDADVHSDLALNDPTPGLSNTIKLERTDYAFDGWDPDVATTVTGNAVYTAKWKPSNKSYTVTKSRAIANAQGTSKEEAEEAEVGDTITYTVTVKSTGNATTDDIVLKDQLTGGDPSKIEIPANSGITQAEDGSLVISVGKLDAGKEKSFTYSYVIQATDKQLKNEVFVGDEKQTEVTVEVEDTPDYELQKTVEVLKDGIAYPLDDSKGNAIAKVGDVLKYTIKVTNTGNVDIEDLTVTDAFKGKGDLKNESGEPVALSDGAFDVVFSSVPVSGSSTVTYTYVVLANDTTVANAVKTDSKTAEANVIVDKNLSYEKTKSAVVTHDGNPIAIDDKAQVGDVIEYKVSVKNTGNVATEKMTITDDFTGDVKALLEANRNVLSQDPESGKVVFTVEPIEVDGTKEITYSYKIQPTDRDISNAIGPENNQQVVIEVKDEPAYEISKVATLNGVVLDGKSEVKAGDKINYRLTVTNTGNVAVSDIALEDAMTVDGNPVDLPENVWWSEENNKVIHRDGNKIAIDSIEKGASLSVWYDYEVQATDSKISNTLNSGDEKKVVVETDVDDNPAYEISKTASVSTKDESGNIQKRELSSGDQVKVGDTITYTLQVENTGNVKLQNIQLADSMKVNGKAVDLPAAITGLKPYYVIRDGNTIKVTNLYKGQSYEVSYSYTVKAKDASVNNVLVSGDQKDGVDLSVEENEAISVSKSFTIWRNGVRVAEAEKSGQVKVGDEIHYQVSLENKGNTTLDEVVVKDSMENASGSFTKVKGATWDEAKKSFIVKWPSSNSYSTITYNYTVQREDVGKILANVAAVGENEGSASTKVEPEFTLTGEIDHGTVSIPEQKLLADETSEAIEFAAAPGYRIVKVTVNGESIELAGLEDENGAILDYIFEATKIDKDTKIEVVTADINEIAFSAPDVTETYNSEAVWYGFESVTMTNLPTGYSATGQVMGSRTNVGTTVTTIENITIFDNNGQDVTERFAGRIETIPGSITITRAQVTIRVNDANKIAGQADPVFSGYVEDPKDFYDELGDITYARITNDEGVGVYTDAITAVYDTTNENFEVNVVPGTFTIIAGPAPIVPAAVVPGAPAPVPGVAAPAPAPAEEITDDATPMSQNPEGEEEEGEEEEIIDDENPLGAFDVKHCWTHWMMLLGILLTAAYGIAVARRRSTFTNDLDDFEKSVTGESRKVRSTVTVRTGSHQAI